MALLVAALAGAVALSRIAAPTIHTRRVSAGVVKVTPANATQVAPSVGRATASVRPVVPVAAAAPPSRSYAATVVVPTIAVYREPKTSAATVVRLARTNEYGAPQTFLIDHAAKSSDGRTWYQVFLPVKPNGSKGWVRAADVTLSTLRYAVIAHLRSFRMDVYLDGRRAMTLPIGVGSSLTPTPPGKYYVTELVQPPTKGTPYGDYVLGLSGHSEYLRNWPDGGQIAIHGTNDPATIGRRASNGCLHLRNADVDRLVRLLPLGTPVEIFDA